METEHTDFQADIEAERWFGRLDAGCSPLERDSFERWRLHPANARAFHAIEHAWQVMAELRGHSGMERLLAATHRRTRTSRRSVGRHAGMAAAASIVLGVLASGAFMLGQHYVPTRTYTTDFGQRSTLQLEDGSEVILNSATRLQVRFAGDKRQFELKAGEAIFTVAQDPARPFTVAFNDSRVTALGTRFQVRNDKKRVTVTLLEGRIALDRESTEQHLQLRPGEQVRYAEHDPQWKRRRVDPEAVSSWITGRLRFKDAPLFEVLEEVNRYSRIKIRLADTSLRSTPVNATLEMGNSAAVVSALQMLLPLDAVTQARNQVVLLRRPE